MIGRVAAFLACLSSLASAARYEPAFDPRAHRAIAGPPTEILVLGSPHLSGLPPAFTPASLGPVLDRLAAWKPGLITIEALSGAECDHLKRYAALYPGTFDDYCWDPAPAEKATGLDVARATVEARRLLAAWPTAPLAADRRRLAATFLAAGDRASALVQWLRLPEAERHVGDGLDAALVETLRATEDRRNENYQIAARLAARLGLERVYPADDHTADDVTAALGTDFDKAMQRIWAAAAPRIAKLNAKEAGLGTPAATLDLYRYYNLPATMDDAFASDFGAALCDDTPALYGRRYVGWWEVRNLRMVANIRAVSAGQPGVRVLSVVGASHKGYFEAYLAMMHEVRLVDAAAILK
jgi:hypothetical protein